MGGALHIFPRFAITRWLSLAAFLGCLHAAPAPAQEFSTQPLRIVTVGSGAVGGAYYEAAKAICSAFNGMSGKRRRCSPDPTPGSLYNLAALRRGDLDFAIVQSDLQRAAVASARGTAPTEAAPDLRSVVSLYPEPLTILARREAQVRSINDLRGLRVDLGPINSGRRPTVERLFDALELAEDDFASQTAIAAPAALEELCAGRLDAVILVIGHPNSAVAQTLAECDVDLLGASGPAIGRFVSDNPDFAFGTIAATAYPELASNVPTFSVMATVVTRRDVPAPLVSAFTRTLLDTRQDLAQAGTPGEGAGSWMQGLTAPLHPAARQALQDRGLTADMP